MQADAGRNRQQNANGQKRAKTGGRGQKREETRLCPGRPAGTLAETRALSACFPAPPFRPPC
eukprot:928374-Lingulodinium_polyedra.AAC.1